MPKTKIWSLLFGLSFLLLINSCGDNRLCEKGEGDYVTKEFNLSDFTGIKVENSVKVFIEQGSEQSVFVEGQENIIDLIELDIQDDTWEIEFDQCVQDADQIKIYITLPEVEYLSVSGSGSIRSQNTLTGDELVLRVSGSGEIDVSIDTEKLDSKISGSGEIILEGETEDVELKVSGSGDYDAFNLYTDKGEINITGSGDAELHVLDILDVKITGSGDVLYKGNPILNVKITGSGEVINAN